jgi:hypothetical protein
VLVPAVPQQQQEGMVAAGVDMPGTWRVVASTGCNMTSVSSTGIIRLNSRSLVQQLEPLAADYSLLRAHYSQVGGIDSIDDHVLGQSEHATACHMQSHKLASCGSQSNSVPLQPP